MVQIEFLCFLDKISFWSSLGSLQAHFLRSFWDLNLGLGRLNPQKLRFGRHLKKRPEKHVKKGQAGRRKSSPCAPLKDLQKADQQDDTDPRDTPLVRKRTVADIYIYIHMFVCIFLFKRKSC